MASVSVTGIEEADLASWEAAFPGGLGPCAFASPRFQKLAIAPEEPSWNSQLLRVQGPNGALTLPVMARRTRGGRWAVATRPIGYGVVPIDESRPSQEEVRAIVDAVCSPRFSSFGWWLPPWASRQLHLESERRWCGSLEVSTFDSYVITFEGSAENHMANRVSKTMRRYVRGNQKRGLTAVTNPDPEARREYYELYRSVYQQQSWIGPMFTWEFFEGVASDLGSGGELVLFRFEGEIAGGGVLLYDHDAVHYFQGAIDRDARGVYPHVGLYHYALEQAEKRKLTYLQLGGINPGNTGLARFKESWGAVATPVVTVKWDGRVRRTLGRFLRRAS